jgi:hypothetical protein
MLSSLAPASFLIISLNTTFHILLSSAPYMAQFAYCCLITGFATFVPEDIEGLYVFIDFSPLNLNDGATNLIAEFQRILNLS